MFTNNKLAKSVKLACAFGAASAALLTSNVSLAQDNASAEEQSVEKISVVGSRIRKVDFATNAPVATVGVEQFELTNSVNTEALLNTLPQTVPGLDRSSNNPGGGIATVDLRGLGTSRTLVLVDGVRAVPTTSAGTVDINTIPAALIENVEVLTGGASAVYGSDAVAGVVNFSLKRNFEGVEVNSSYEQTEDGDADIWNTAITVGGNFDGGKGNAVVSMQYTEREALFADARDISSIALTDASDANGDLFLEPFGSSGVPGTSIFSGALPENFGGAAVFNPDGTIRPFVQSGNENDFYNFAPVNYLQLPQERHNITAIARYEISDDAEVYMRGSFANSNVPQQLAATPIFQTSTFTLDGNPFIDSDAQQIISDAFGQGVDTDGDGIDDQGRAFLRRRLLEVGPRQVEDDSQMYSMLAGIRGAIGDSVWMYDGYFQVGRVTQNSIQLGNVNRGRFDQALLLATDENGDVVLDADGNPSCANTSANGGLVGCSPLNLYGEGNISADAAQFLRTRVNADSTYEQKLAAFNITGDSSDWFELPAGPIGLAFGVEHREEDFSFDPSQDLAASTIAGFNGSPAVSGSFNVNEYFAEAYVPLLEGMDYAEIVDLELAYRYADWSTVGGTTAFKVAGSWTVNDMFRVRAGFNRAVRAPNIGELFQPEAQGFPSAEDPCSLASGNGDGANADAIRAVCEATGVPADAVFTSTLNAISGQTPGIFVGNEDLKEEEADTLTVGLVVTPTDNLSISVDYFDIEITDAIATFSGGVANILSTCYTSSNGGEGSPQCDAITRREDGSIQQVLAPNENTAVTKLTGFDIITDYSIDVGPGNMSINYLGTILDESSTTYPGPFEIDCTGQFGNVCLEPTTEYSHRMTVGYSIDDFDMQLLWRFIGSTDDDSPTEYFREETGSFSYFDLSGTYHLNENFRFNAGVRNLLDKEPPAFGGNAEQSNTWPATYDVFGRTFFAGVTARF